MNEFVGDTNLSSAQKQTKWHEVLRHNLNSRVRYRGERVRNQHENKGYAAPFLPCAVIILVKLHKLSRRNGDGKTRVAYVKLISVSLLRSGATLTHSAIITLDNNSTTRYVGSL